MTIATFFSDSVRWILGTPMGVLLTLALLGYGCATVPVASDTEDASAKAFTPSAGRANIYVVRDGGYLPGRVVLRVVLDGAERGALSDKTYFVFSVEPGRHVVASYGAENEEQVRLEVDAGQNWFVSLRSRIGWERPRLSLKQLSEEEGRRAVLEARLAKGL